MYAFDWVSCAFFDFSRYGCTVLYGTVPYRRRYVTRYRYAWNSTFSYTYHIGTVKDNNLMRQRKRQRQRHMHRQSKRKGNGRGTYI